MISVQKAIEAVLNQQLAIGSKKVPLEDAIGCLLREDLKADRDFPPYDRVTMDGIAIAFDSFEKGVRAFPVESIGAAGMPQVNLTDAQKCVEIMTGAILPKNADTIIRYEDVTIENRIATINIEEIRKGQNIHRQGIDRKKGEVVVPAGRLISPAEIGVAATIGKPSLLVAEMPRVMIISTGDELVDVKEQPLPHQIRKSNVHRLKATLKSWGMPCDTTHLIDDEETIFTEMEQILASYQVIMMSGGVSKGKFDFIPKVLDRLGVEKLFHKIKQRPGKPFWFGKTPNGTLVFALPGNPVSSFMCTVRYFQPWLKASLGLPISNGATAILQDDVPFKPDLTYFAQVKIAYSDDGRILAHPVEGHGSGDLANLVDADAFLELPQGRDVYPAGEAFAVYFFR